MTIRQRASLRDLIEAIPEEDWTPIPYWMDGAADVAETTYPKSTEGMTMQQRKGDRGKGGRWSGHDLG